jgi:hypothetical protein
MTGRALATLLLLALSPASSSAQLMGHEREELARLDSFAERLEAIQGRVRSGGSGVLPNTGGPPGSPAWIEVRLPDLRQQIAVLVLTGEISPAEAGGMAAALGRGNRLIADELGRVRARIEALRKRDLAPAGPMGAGPGTESWRFVLTGRDTNLRDSPSFTSTGTLELTIQRDGGVHGTARWDNRGAWDDAVEGTLRDGRLTLEYGSSNSMNRGTFGGQISPDGTATGEFRINRLAGTWRATRR